MAEVTDSAATIARVRAEEASLPPGERLFSDPSAALFHGGAGADEVTALYFRVPFFKEAVRIRTRFIDDVVRAALADGIRQLALLGAGFDCRGLRLPEIVASGAVVFEIDFAAQLEAKRRILAGAGVALPHQIRPVACDFAAPEFEAALGAALAVAGFHPGAGSCFVWEGVVGYLNDEPIDRSLRFMARAGGPGSRLVFNYQSMRLDSVRLAARVRAAGFTTQEEHTCEALYRRYLGDAPPPGGDLFRIVVARTASPQ
jgi:methyltransferase (TIGR00027 family)